MINAICGGCGATFSVAESYAGKTGKCRKCGASVSIPNHPASGQLLPATDASGYDDEGELTASPSCQITTTDLIHGWTVTGYKGLVTAHIVAGTGLFSDFAASWTDIFGGRSGTYQRQLAAMEEEAMDSLRSAAERRGANWVIGTRLDFDEISGKGVQMFMITAQGTAVHAIATPTTPASEPIGSRLQGVAVRDQIRRDSIRRRLTAVESGEQAVTDEFLEMLCDLKVLEAVPLCIRVALSVDEGYAPRTTQLAKEGLRLLPRKVVRDAIHQEMSHARNPSAAVALYRDLGLLDLRWVLQQITTADKHIRRLGLQVLCQCVAATYSAVDISILRDLRTAVVKSFPETAREVEVINLFGSQSRKWRCEYGHDNSLEHHNCEACGIDRYGVPRGGYNPDIAMKVIDSTLIALESYFHS